MTKKPVKTIEDVARLAGVSKSTVSRALNDSPLIGKDTREKIQALAREHDFQIHVAARRLSMQESRTIAFVTHTYHKDFCLTDLFGLEMLGAISNALAAKQYDLLMAHVDPYDTTWVRQYLDTGRADGFILMTSTRKKDHIHSLIKMRAPFIAWGIPDPGQHYCSVTGDNQTGGRLAAEHLISTGRKKIAFLGGPAEELEVQLRFQGFQEANQAAGLAVEPGRITYTDFSSSGAERAARLLLDQAPDLDAIFANSDVMAIAAMEVLRESGRRIPDDVAVVGYDNLSIAGLSNPTLTTINQNLPLAGKLLAENLIQYLQSEIVTNVSIPVELVHRNSS